MSASSVGLGKKSQVGEQKKGKEKNVFSDGKRAHVRIGGRRTKWSQFLTQNI